MEYCPYSFTLNNVSLALHEQEPGMHGYDRWYFNLLNNLHAIITWEGRNWHLSICSGDWGGDLYMSETFASCEDALAALNKNLDEGQSIELV